MPLYSPFAANPLAGPSLGFYGAPPVVRPGPFTQTYTPTNWVLGAYTANTQSSAYTGGLLDLLQAGRLTDVNTLRVAYENLRVMTENLAQQHNSLISDLKSLGLVS